MKTDNSQFTKMGMAAMLPGLVYEHERLGQLIAQLRSMISEDQDGDALPVRKGKPPKMPDWLKDVEALEQVTAPKNKAQWTDEQRAAAAERMRERNNERWAKVKKAKKGATKKTKKAKPVVKLDKAPEMIDGKRTMLSVAREVGYSDTWGLTLLMRKYEMQWTQARGPNGRMMNVISEAQYQRIKRLRAGEREETEVAA